MHVFTTTDVPADKIVFGKLKKGHDTYMMSTYYSDDQQTLSKIFVQTPKMVLTTEPITVDGVQSFVTFSSEDASIREMLTSIEDTVLQQLKLHKDTWFVNKGIDDLFLENGLTSTVLKNNVFRFRLMDDVQVYDGTKRPIKLNNIKKGDVFKCIIQLTGLWFTPSRWGITWKVMQIKSTAGQVNVDKYKDYMFKDDGEEIDEDDSVLTVPPSV
jgi:hypothetical protein